MTAYWINIATVLAILDKALVLKFLATHPSSARIVLWAHCCQQSCPCTVPWPDTKSYIQNTQQLYQVLYLGFVVSNELVSSCQLGRQKPGSPLPFRCAVALFGRRRWGKVQNLEANYMTNRLLFQTATSPTRTVCRMFWWAPLMVFLILIIQTLD